MLYKNDEPYKLSEPEIEKLVRHFHNKFPLKVVYPPDRIVKSRLPHNRLPDKPNSISFDFRAVVKTDKGSETWRYVENIVTDARGKKRYLPKKFIFNGARFLERNDIEMIYFLFKKSPYCLGGENQGKVVKFMFEDLVTEAEKKAAKKELDTKIGLLLYNKEYGLPEERLRAVAKAYFIRNVDNLTPAQVRIVLENKIYERKDGPDKFFDMVNAEEELKARGSIQRAIDMEILHFDAQKRVWFWQTKGEKGVTQVCKVPPTKNASDVLYDLFLGDQGFRDDLQAVLISKNPKAGRLKGRGGENIDEEQE